MILGIYWSIYHDLNFQKYVFHLKVSYLKFFTVYFISLKYFYEKYIHNFYNVFSS